MAELAFKQAETIDEAEIAAFLRRLVDSGIATRRAVPEALTRDSQLHLLETRLAALCERRERP